jgi:isopenicillin N synthase-like dioxygenase
MTGTTDFAALPVIDIAPLIHGNDADKAVVATQLGDAARHVGFMYLTGTGIGQSLVDSLQAAAARFFALPFDKKMAVYIGNSTNHRGYVPEGEEVFAGGGVDKKEAYDLSLELPADDPRYLAGNPLLGPNQWPDLPGFADDVTAYYSAVFELGRLVLRGFALALGRPETYFDHYVTEPPSQLRLLHYPEDLDAVDRLGIGAHTDYECFTILKPTAPGLEVLNGAGVWIDAPPVPDAFVLNIGDMLELWTNGEFVATTHRVRKVTSERYSFPLFFSVDYDTVVEPLPEFVTPERPARAPLIAGEHLHAQTAQSFTYLRNRLAEGDLRLPDGALALSSFGHTARLGA